MTRLIRRTGTSQGFTESLPLTAELVASLRRHDEPESDFVAAELLVAESVGNVVPHTGGPVWVSPTWRGAKPAMSVYDLGPGSDQAFDAATKPASELSLSTTRSHPTPATTPRPHSDLVDLEALPESGRGLVTMQELAPRRR